MLPPAPLAAALKPTGIALGLAGCLVLLLWQLSSPPTQPDRRTTQVDVNPVTAFPAPSVAATPGAAMDTSLNSERSPKPAAKPQDDVADSVLREHLLAAMKSADNADRDLSLRWTTEWVQRDPKAAARFAGSLPAGEGRETILRRVGQGGAARDPAGAERWVARLPEKSERDSALSDVCLQVAQTDARHAVEIAEQHGLATAPGDVLEELVQRWAGQDLAGASAWIQEHPAGEQRDQLLGRLAYVQSQSDPAAAARLVVEQIPGSAVQDEAIMMVLHQWAQRDFVAASAWANLFPYGALRDRAQKELQGIAAYSR